MTMLERVRAEIERALQETGDADMLAALAFVDLGPVARAAIEAMREPTDELIRVSLATDLPATFRSYLRHPDNGPISAKDTEIRIKHEHKRWGNLIDAALSAKPSTKA